MSAGMKHALPFAVALALAGCADSPEARLARAEESFAANDYRRAQIDLAAALQAEPGNVRALELAARSHLAQGDGVAAQGALAKLAAASIDDVGAAAGRASMKAAGVVVDDTAVTPTYVHGLAASRELPGLASRPSRRAPAAADELPRSAALCQSLWRPGHSRRSQLLGSDRSFDSPDGQCSGAARR